jgi:hypothetical protein
MKKFIKAAFFTLMFCLLFLLNGCITTTNVVPLVYTNNINTEFEILGTFTHKSTNPIGYVDIYNIAKKQYPDTDFVIDIVIDQHIEKISYHIIVFLLKQIFSADFGKTESFKYEYVMRGTAIRYMQKKYVEKYTVTKVIGNPQWESMGTFVYVKVGDVLTNNTIVRLPMDSSIVLTDGNKNITLQGTYIGKIYDIIMKL